MGQDGEGCFVEAWQRVAQRFVSAPVGDLRALEIGFVLSQSDVLAVGARLLLLQGVAAALVALVVDLLRLCQHMTASLEGALSTFASSRFFIVLCMGLRASLASLAGMMSLRSMSLTSSIMSVFSSEKASCRACTRSRVGWGVSAATREVRPASFAPNGLKMVYMCSTVASWWLRMLVQASRHCLEDSSSYSSQYSCSTYLCDTLCA